MQWSYISLWLPLSCACARVCVGVDFSSKVPALGTPCGVPAFPGRNFPSSQVRPEQVVMRVLFVSPGPGDHPTRQYLLCRAEFLIGAWAASVWKCRRDQHFLWLSCNRLDSCMVPCIKISLSQIIPSGRLDKYNQLYVPVLCLPYTTIFTNSQVITHIHAYVASPLCQVWFSANVLTGLNKMWPCSC